MHFPLLLFTLAFVGSAQAATRKVNPCEESATLFAALAETEQSQTLKYLTNPQSPEIWKAYDKEFVSAAKKTMAAANSIYQTALGFGDRHAKWLQSVGFTYADKASSVKAPSLRNLLLDHETKLNALIAKGFPEKDAIRPARVFKDAKGELQYLPYGAPVPEGYRPMTEIIPVPYTLKMLDEGYLPLGENAFMNSASVRGKITFIMHDYAHHAAHLEHPEYMAALRQLGKRLRDERAFFPRLRYPTQEFTAEEVAKLLTIEAIPSFALERAGVSRIMDDQGLAKFADFLNHTDPATKEHLATQLTKDSVADNARKNMGLRLAVYLENSSLVDKDTALAFRSRQEKKGWIPVKEPAHHFDSSEITMHLAKYSQEELRQMLAETADEFPRLITRYGGGLRDVVQASERLRLAREGYSQFFSIDALYPDALATLKRPYASKGELMVVLGKMQTAIIEAGRVDIADWGAQIANPKLDPKSSLYHFLCRSWVFERDAYYVAHCE
ncbi:MAG: hypothetical protein EOP11_01990 [Proteobacteria bacterium]|nr:MAG: hypothetical protein EOP11_01990 [Pseudomonadota bacterium]